jgi:hypothetical protein
MFWQKALRGRLTPDRVRDFRAAAPHRAGAHPDSHPAQRLKAHRRPWPQNQEVSQASDDWAFQGSERARRTG